MDQLQSEHREQTAPGKRKGQVFGILSVIIFGITTCVLLVIGGLFFLAFSPGEGDVEGRGAAVILGFSLLLASAVPLLIGNIIGCVLGIIGLVQKNRRKVFALIGVTLNSIVPLICFVLFLVVKLRDK